MATTSNCQILTGMEQANKGRGELMAEERVPEIGGFLRRQESLPDEEMLYQYFLKRLGSDPAANLLSDFRHLFIEGRGFKQAEAYAALERIAQARHSQERFIYFLNRCCHILINYWQMYPQLHPAIPELVRLFENLPPARNGYTGAQHLRHLVAQFAQSDHYLKLQRIARVIDAKSDSNLKSVGNLIHRYPYLYDHCLLSEDSTREHQQTVRRMKTGAERRFEVNLSQYVTYKVRLAQARTSSLSGESGRIIRPVINPTLLTDRELNKALKQFVGTVEGNYTYKLLSQNFINYTAYTPTFKAFKQDLYQYLSSSLESPYAQGQLSPKLEEILENVMPQCNQQEPSEFLMLRTSSQLLNFLIVESTHDPQHYLFVDMITNLGVTHTVGLLLKLVLVCRKVKPYLEKRLSILFNHYESFTRDGVPWLVKALEYLQIAFSIHFGKVDLSSLKEIRS